MKCAIYGAGSLGTVLGAYLTKNGIEIDLINRNKKHIEALKNNGAIIKGTINLTVPVKAITPDEMSEKYDYIFLMTKQLYNKEVVEFLKDYLTDDGIVVTFQNGLPEPDIANIIGSEHTVGCVVEWGATLAEPGVCVLTSSPDSLSFHMGKMTGVKDEKLMQIKDILENMCTVYIEDNLIGARWSKLLINCTFSGLGTVLGGTFKDVFNNPKGREIAIRCMKECIDVGRAANVEFALVQGKDITKLFYYTNKLKCAIGKFIMPIAMKKHGDIEPSMLQDLKNGKACEIDAINGVICKYGKEYNVPTPINDRIVEIIKKQQSGDLGLTKDNINLFDDLL